jgi:YidC/Oxa1 family membrane protein insertase
VSGPWNALLDIIEQVLRFFHSAVTPLFGPSAAWGWAIILLTIAVRVFLLPLAVKQTRSQRAMQRLQPEMKKIQTKYKAERGLMRTNPEKYREQRAKQQEAMMALYKEHNVNPAAGCLPLVAQMPIFFALFSVLRDTGRLPELGEASFYFVRDLAATVTQVGAPAYLLVLLMGATTFVSSRQMMANTAAVGQQQAQQKMMLYAMPLILVFFSLNLYIGVLLYWITTNVWTIAQQYVMFRGSGEQPPSGAADARARAARSTARQ